MILSLHKQQLPFYKNLPLKLRREKNPLRRHETDRIIGSKNVLEFICVKSKSTHKQSDLI